MPVEKQRSCCLQRNVQKDKEEEKADEDRDHVVHPSPALRLFLSDIEAEAQRTGV